jgi:hypothetical protein
MKRVLALGALAVVGALSLTSLASGSTAHAGASLKFSATLSMAQVTPHLKGINPAEQGTFSAILTGTNLKWTLTYSHLSGPAVAAHIHLGAPGKNGIALVALCGPPACKSAMSGTANSVTDDIGALMSKSGAYVNVHTDKNPEGEIRGEIKLAH